MVPRSYCHILKKFWGRGRVNSVCWLSQNALRGPTNSCSFSLSAWLSSRTSYTDDKNIILMGPPGAGKTTVGRMVAQKLGLPVIDVDDDVLERKWNMSVADKLAEVGGERFLEEEGEALSDFSATGSVVSLTGSNPLHAGAMQRLKRNGVVLYLDVDTEDIVRRLSAMKVDRIVGQGPGVSMRDILRYRQQFYNRWYDARVLCGSGDTAEEVAENVLRTLERYRDSESETFVSTRGGVKGTGSAGEPKHFSDVVVEGLASDGGLYVPEKGFPKLEKHDWLRMVGMSYPERATTILEKCIHPLDVPAAELRRMVHEAYGGTFADEAIAPVKHLIHNQYVQELFHGPTASFKDLALQLMPRLFAYCLPQMCNYLILVATSGDTGSAVLNGFASLGDADRRRVGVLVFFPEEGVSEIQKLQMTSFREGNARAVGVGSDFDFCQRAIKRMFGDASLTGHLAVEYAAVLSTANSINWARLLPQVVYHSSAYLDLVREGAVAFGDPVDVCVPTGNFGNVMSAAYARQMGIPIRKLICASNQNRVVTDFMATGEYDLRNRPLIPSSSPAIDILKSSNLERFLFHASDSDGQLVRSLFCSLERERHFKVPGALLERVRRDILAGWCSESDCLAAIHDVHSSTGYILDTHTAVGKVVADRLQDRTCPVVISSTAHYGKFAPAVLGALRLGGSVGTPLDQLGGLGALGSRPPPHGALLECLREGSSRPHPVCPADFAALEEQVEIMIQDSFCKVA
ncbi:threonine synthase-like 1 [Megalops cyprinoides]|uniref:threonine synthase-like 1 n=1 Tax=Megalops cyprinoides TaxID=118141 RepID=UPI001864CE2E|nr:threonine synthase-like 1 [Megalops cyprinoides]